MTIANSPVVPESQPMVDPMVDPMVADPTLADQPVEPPQDVTVAGPIGSAITAIAKPIGEFVGKAEERTYGLQPEDEVIKGPGGNIIIQPMANEDLTALNNNISEAGFESGINLGRIGEIFDQLDPATQARMQGEDAGGFNLETLFTNIKENNQDLFNYLRRDKKTMDEMMQLANATGYESIAFKFLRRKPGDVMPPEDVLAGMIGVIKMGQEIEKGAQAVVAAAGNPERELAEFRKLKLLATMTSNLAAQVGGNVSEYGRGLAVISNVNKLNINVGDYAESLDQFVSEMDEGMIQFHAQALLSMENPAARAKYAEKGFLAKTYDFAMENYINALLSGFQTHAVNIAGNFGFQMQTLAETGVAGIIGNIRTVGGMRGEVGDQAYIGEASAEAFGLMMAQRDALTLMAKTFVTGESSDVVNKIDLRNQRALGSTDNILDIKRGIANFDFSKSAKDMLGIATRMSGRFLATEDEYFKVITRRRVLYREAHRAGQIAYQNARKTGVSRSEAKELSQQAYTKTMITPPTAVQNMMTTEARKMTFQGQPDGFFGRMAPFINDIPAMKVIAPFYNTPTNIINEAFDRTLNWSPVYRAIKGKIQGEELISGKELDRSLAKLALGNSVALIMYGLASSDDRENRNVIFTGMLDRVEGIMGLDGIEYRVTGSIGGLDTRLNIAGAANVPPYSIGVWNDEKQTYEWTQYSRFDPMSALLAMGADMAEYARYGDEPGMTELAMAYSLAVAEYAESLPFLQGVSELVNAISGRGSLEDDLPRILKWAGEDVVGNLATNVAGNLDRSVFGLGSYAAEFLSGGDFVPVTQTSFLASLERVQYPERSSTKLPAGNAPFTDTRYTELSPFMQGFYEALQKAKARNPFFSPDLNPKLSFWGDEMIAEIGKKATSLNPLRTSQGELRSLDEEIIRLTEVGVGNFGYHRDRIGETRLNSDQYNMYVRTINTIDERGRMPGDTGYDAADALKMAMTLELTTEEYILGSDEDKFDLLSSLLIDRRGRARKWMTGEPKQPFGSGGDSLLDAMRVQKEMLQ